MAVINPPAYLHNVATTTGQIDRLAAICAGMAPSAAGVSWMDGVRGVGDLIVSAGAGMSVNVAAGLAFVKGTIQTFQGMYVVPNDGVVNLAISAANASLARNDLIIVRVQDSQYAGSNNLGTLEVVTGTAAASPADPTPPANSLTLARVVVPAAAASIVSGNITDLREWTAALGGSIPVRNAAQRDAMTKFDGLTVYRMDNHNVEVWNASTSIWMGEQASGTSGITAATGWSVASQTWSRKNGMAPANGNLSNVQVGTLPVGLRPVSKIAASSGETGVLSTWVVNTTGTIHIAATTPSQVINTSEQVSVGGSFIL
jgi:hypothetical protein